MENRIKTAVVQAGVQTLSEMGFIDAAEVRGTLGEIVDPLCVRIKILMPFFGDLYVIASKKIAGRLIENSLVEEPDEQCALVVDAMKEFTNVVAGLIFQLVAPELLFELGLPEEGSVPSDLARSSQLIFLRTYEGDLLCIAHQLCQIPVQNQTARQRVI